MKKAKNKKKSKLIKLQKFIRLEIEAFISKGKNNLTHID